MRNQIFKAIQDSDHLVVEFDYRDQKGQITRRVVSPIRFLGGNRFLGLCLSREEPRQFRLDQCSNLSLRNSHEYLMPVPIQVSGAVSSSASLATASSH